MLVTPNDRTVGNTAEEIYFALLLAKKQHKKVFFLRRFKYHPDISHSNLALFNLESPYIWGANHKITRFMGYLFLTLLYDPLSMLPMYLYRNSKSALKAILFLRKPHYFRMFKNNNFFHDPEFGTIEIFRGNFVQNKYESENFWKAAFEEDLELDLKAEDSKKCFLELNNLGIPNDSWFVCLHVREGGFYGDFSTPRNSDIRNCDKAIDHIISLGGYVIRMGDNTMKPLPIRENVIDYPFTSFKSPLMDIFLIKNCRFYIGTNSGILDVAKMFQKKIVLINSTEYKAVMPLKMKDLALIKRRFSISKNRELTLDEVLSLPYTDPDGTSPRTETTDLKYIENTPEEIYHIVLEAIESESKFEYTERQILFNQKRKTQIEEWLEKYSFFNDTFSTELQTARTHSRLFSNGAISEYFLNKDF